MVQKVFDNCSAGDQRSAGDSTVFVCMCVCVFSMTRIGAQCDAMARDEGQLRLRNAMYRVVVGWHSH